MISLVEPNEQSRFLCKPKEWDSIISESRQGPKMILEAHS